MLNILPSLSAALAHGLRRAAASVLLACSLAGALAAAQTVAHRGIAAQLAAGNAQAALEQATRALAETPRDPQLQFLKANAELALGQTEAAEASLTQLTQNYPELAEPWNNLAVIRAGQGRLDEAQQLLAQALTSNPDYADAHRNMADVLLQLAIRHLEAANQLAHQADTQARLQALRALVAPH